MLPQKIRVSPNLEPKTTINILLLIHLVDIAVFHRMRKPWPAGGYKSKSGDTERPYYISERSIQ